MVDLHGVRVLAVHAHPDDEAIWTGGALAQLARRGAEVTVVTCTLGEQGEVIGEPFQGLVADQADQLGGFRIRELQASLRALGVSGEFLGGAGHWRDSGMIGDEANDHPRAFIHSGPDGVAALVEVLDRVDPHLVLTYGPDGGYGHPDHVRAHNITHEAIKQHPVPRVLWAVTHQPTLSEGLSEIEEIPQGWRMPQSGELAAVSHVDVAQQLSPVDVEAKLLAMKAHPTQLWIADGETSATNPQPARARLREGASAVAVFALSNLIAQPLLAVEHYQLGHGSVPDASDIASGLAV